MDLKIGAPYQSQVDISFSYNEGLNWSQILGVPIEKFEKIFSKTSKFRTMETLPPAIRWVAKDRSMFLWERRPFYATYKYTPALQGNIRADADAKYQYRLPIPWQRYFVCLRPNGTVHHVRMFFANDQIRSLDNDPMCIAPLLNFYNDGSLCLAAYTNPPRYPATIEGAMSSCYDLIWNSGFNLDLYRAVLLAGNHFQRDMWRHALSTDSFIHLFSAWQNKPMEWILEQNWPAGYSSFNTLLRALSSRNDDEQTEAILVNLLMSAQDAKQA